MTDAVKNTKQQQIDLEDINCLGRLFSEYYWTQFMRKPGVATFVLVANFFFAILPGVLYFATNVRILQEEDEYIERDIPDIQSMADWFAIIFVIFPIFVSIWQIRVFHRLISLRMPRTFLFGQIISLALYMLCFSKDALRFFIWFPRNYTIPCLSIILIVIIYLTFFQVYIRNWSELQVYKNHPCLKHLTQKKAHGLFQDIKTFFSLSN